MTINKSDAIKAVYDAITCNDYAPHKFEEIIAEAAIEAIRALPAISVTDEMVERASAVYYRNKLGNVRHCLAIRAALEAALGPLPQPQEKA
jgi:hypothetical protein